MSVQTHMASRRLVHRFSLSSSSSWTFSLPHLHICVTSRPEFDIRATLGRLALHSVSLHDESGQKEDIVDYVKSVVYSDSEETMMKRWREEDKKMVVETLSEKADGM
jgi:hypothetical protein